MTGIDITQIVVPTAMQPSAGVMIIYGAVPGQSLLQAFALPAGVALNTGTTPPTLVFPVTILPSFVDGEIPAGAINGSNMAFTLANVPSAGSLNLFRNGLLQQQGATEDYTLTGGAVEFNSAPLPGDTLQASYRH